MDMKFYFCHHCGKIIAVIEDTMVPTICCGEAMEELIPGVNDGLTEKHVPVSSVKKQKVLVKVGSEEHPSTEIHYVKWICLATDEGIYFRWLHPRQKPAAEFNLTGNEKPEEVLEYCNLHKLWSSKV